jgi:hypothetical protein
VDWTDLAQKRGQVVGCCEHGNGHLGSIKFGEFLDELIDYWLLRKVSNPVS